MRLQWLILALGLACYVPLSPIAHAVGDGDASIQLQAEILPLQSEAVQGSYTWWHIVLTNLSSEPLTELRVHMDGQVWSGFVPAAGIDLIQPGQVATLELRAVPLQVGEAWPVVHVTYRTGAVDRSVIATADRPVDVKPASAFVVKEVVARGAAAKVGDSVPLDVLVTNSTPFTLTHVTLIGSGPDLDWVSTLVLPDIPPGNLPPIHITPTIEGMHPQPIVILEYGWQDVIGQDNHERLTIQSDPIMVEQGFLSQIPVSAFTALLGAALGLVSWGVNVYNQQRQREQLNRERVEGILDLIQVQAKHAAATGVPMPTDLIQKLFSEEGLYAALEQLSKPEGNDLLTCIRRLWATADRYNIGINRPVGGERTGELAKAAADLERILDSRRPPRSGQAA